MKTPPEIADLARTTAEELFEDGDAFTQEIYGLHGEVARVESAEIARAFVDLNRAPGDRPPANPDGVVKSTTCYGHPVYIEGREPAAELIERLLERYHHPYHSRLREAAADPSVRLALDCHSMAAVAPPMAPDTGAQRPLFCLSNDAGRTCPPRLLERLAAAVAEEFECEREQVWLNRPFKGGYITRSHGGGLTPWVQVEMNRSFYLTEPWFDPSTLRVDRRRLSDLRRRFLAALRQLDL